MSRTKLTVWADSNNLERLFESNVEINSVESKLLHQTNNKGSLVGEWLFKQSQNGAIWVVPQPIQIKSAKFNWVKRRTSQEPN